MLTGLARSEVRRQRDKLTTASPGLTGYVTKASLVLSAWHLDPEFVSTKGKPRLLPREGASGTFAALLRRCGDTVTFTGDVRGPIATIDSRSSFFVVLGQTVHVNSATHFGDSIQPSLLSGLRKGQTVEVSAYVDATGALLATRIDLKDARDGLQVRGVVQNLDSRARTFDINALKVDISRVEGGDFSDGSVVTVKGVASPGGALVARSVQDSSRPAGKEAQEGRLEGLITTFVSSEAFSVGEQPVATNSGTHFILHGQALGPNLAVKVQGSYDASGVLVARKVQTKQP